MMRVFALLLGLGLTLSPTAFVGIGEWAEFTYQGERLWTLDLPGPCGDRQLYEMRGDPPPGDLLPGYLGYTVADWDEELLTITLAKEGTADLDVSFEELPEWLALDEEACETLLLQQQQAELVCASNWCECDGKCSVCCPEGFKPRCVCSATGRCECVAVAEPDGEEPTS